MDIVQCSKCDFLCRYDADTWDKCEKCTVILCNSCQFEFTPSTTIYYRNHTRYCISCLIIHKYQNVEAYKLCMECGDETNDRACDDCNMLLCKGCCSDMFVKFYNIADDTVLCNFCLYKKK